MTMIDHPAIKDEDAQHPVATAWRPALVELPDATWKSSVAQWMGTHWDVVVDLWTDAGPSDLILSARVRETNDAFEIEIGSVYVP